MPCSSSTFPQSHVSLQVADPRLARLSAAAEDTGVAAPRVVSRRQARGDSEEDSDDAVAESSDESEEEDEEVTARRMAVRERQVLLLKMNEQPLADILKCMQATLQQSLTPSPSKIERPLGGILKACKQHYNEFSYFLLPENIVRPLVGILKCMQARLQQSLTPSPSKIERPLGGILKACKQHYNEFSYFLLPENIVRPLVGILKCMQAAVQQALIPSSSRSERSWPRLVRPGQLEVASVAFLSLTAKSLVIVQAEKKEG